MLLNIYIHEEEKQSLKAPPPQGFYSAGYKSGNRHSLPTFAVQSDSDEFWVAGNFIFFNPNLSPNHPVQFS